MPEQPPCLTPILRHKSSFFSALILFKCFNAFSDNNIAGLIPSEELATATVSALARAAVCLFLLQTLNVFAGLAVIRKPLNGVRAWHRPFRTSDEPRELDAANENGLRLMRAEFIVNGAQGSRVQGIDTGRGELNIGE